MIVHDWNKLNDKVLMFIENEEWVGIPENKKQQLLLDLKDPRNIETTLHFANDCDMIKLKLLRSDSPTKITKIKQWVLIGGISNILKTDFKAINWPPLS